MSKYIKGVNSNLGGEFSYDLGPKTLVIAPNQGGKTRLVNAVSLAVRAEGIKIKKKETDLMVFKPIEDKELWVDAEISDGETISWFAEGSTAKASKAKWTRDEPLGTMVFEVAQAVLDGTPEKLRKAILSSLHVGIEKDSIYNSIASDIWPMLDKHWPVGRDVLDIDEFDVLQKQVSSQASMITKQVKALDGDVENIPGMTEDQEAEYTSLLEQKAISGISKEQLESMREQVSGLETEVTNVRKRLEASKVSGDSTALQLARSALGTTTALQVFLKERDRVEFSCPLCGTTASKEQLEARVEKLQRALTMLNAQAEKLSARDEDKRRLEYLRGQLDQLRNRVQQSVVAEPIDENRLNELRRIKDSQERIQSMIRHKADLAQEKSDLDLIKKALKAQSEKTVAANETAFSEKVTSYLPADETAEVKLKEGRRKVCRIYLTSARGTIEMRALSGAESAILVTAVASALYGEGDFRLLVIDDKWFDPVRIRDLLASIDASMLIPTEGPTQAIVCAAQWEGAYPDEWKVLDLRKGGQ